MTSFKQNLKKHTNNHTHKTKQTRTNKKQAKQIKRNEKKPKRETHSRYSSVSSLIRSQTSPTKTQKQHITGQQRHPQIHAHASHFLGVGVKSGCWGRWDQGKTPCNVMWFFGVHSKNHGLGI